MNIIGQPLRQPDGRWKQGYVFEGTFWPLTCCHESRCKGHDSAEGAIGHYEQFMAERGAVQAAEEHLKDERNKLPERKWARGGVITRKLILCVDCGVQVPSPEHPNLDILPALLEDINRCERCAEAEEGQYYERQGVIDQEAVRVQMERAWSACGVPDKYMHEAFETFRLDGISDAIQDAYYAALDWADRFDLRQPRVRGLLLASTPGTGKTHLAAAIGRRALERLLPSAAELTLRRRILSQEVTTHEQWQARRTFEQQDRVPRLFEHFSVRFWEAPNLLNKLVDARFIRFEDKGRDTEEEMYHRLSGERLLVLDDLGKVQRASQQREQELVWYRVFNDRYNTQLPVIITTNKTLDELPDVVGAAVMDRLWEMVDVLDMSGDSYRPRKRRS